MSGRGGENFQGVRPLEAVAAARAHMFFGLGWVDGCIEGKVVFLRQGSVWESQDLVGEDDDRGLMIF